MCHVTQLMAVSLLSLTWENVVAGVVFLYVLVGPQEQSLALVVNGPHWDAGTRGKSDPWRSGAPRSGPSLTWNTWLHRLRRCSSCSEEMCPDVREPDSPFPSRLLFPRRAPPSWLRGLILAWASGTVRTTSSHRLAATSHHLIPAQQQHRPGLGNVRSTQAGERGLFSSSTGTS